MKKTGFLLLLSLIYCIYSAQNNPADSLRKLLSAAKHDTIRARIYSILTECCFIEEIKPYAEKTIELSDKYLQKSNKAVQRNLLKYKSTAIGNLAYFEESSGNIEKGIKLYTEALKIREEIKDTAAAGNTLFNLANLYKTNSNIEKALALNNKALTYFKKTNHQIGAAKTLFALGEIHYDRGDLKKAIEHFDSALVYARKANSKGDIATILTGIGVVHGVLGNRDKELEYLVECEKLQREINDNFGLSITYNNLGFIADSKKDYKKSLEYYGQSLKYAFASDDPFAVALSYHNIGSAWTPLNTDSALRYFEKSLLIKRKLNDERGQAISEVNVAKILYAKGNKTQAKKLLLEASVLGEKLRLKEIIMNSSESLAEIFADEGNFREAYRHQKLFKIYSDSLFNEQNHKASYKQQIKLEFEQKEAEAKILARLEKDQIESRAREAQKRTYIILSAVTAVTLLLLLLAVFIFKAYRQKKKANTVLEEKNTLIELQKLQVEEQKELVEEKQKEILDSIHYAKRIQSAILAKEEEIFSRFPKSFLLYQPKDIVAGDFYFFESVNNFVFYAAADCTGHGVPGALVSVVCSNALNRCVKEFALTEPGQILDKTRELVIETFKKSGQDVKDGMDISLLVKNIKENTYSWAGANNPLWILKHESANYTFTEIKADKQPIGLSENMLPFKSHHFTLSEKDWIFLFTDGYADQFGGPKGKKFKYRQLMDLISDSANKPAHHLKTDLENTFIAWKGDLEQVDDVCIIGIQH